MSYTAVVYVEATGNDPFASFYNESRDAARQTATLYAKSLDSRSAKENTTSHKVTKIKLFKEIEVAEPEMALNLIWRDVK